MSIFRRTALALALAAPLAMAAAPAFAQDKDIVDTATADTNLSTLVKVIKAAGLADTLKGKGPYTVFAPTDEAFKKLSPGTLDDLLKPENKATLVSILKYHVLPGIYDAARITKPTVKQFGITSVEGSNVNVDLRKGLIVSGATVTKTDIKASNGIIHTVDAVIMPRKARITLAAQALKVKAAAAAVAAREMAGKAAAAAKDAAVRATEAAKAAATKATTPTTPPAATPAPKAP